MAKIIAAFNLNNGDSKDFSELTVGTYMVIAWSITNSDGGQLYVDPPIGGAAALAINRFMTTTRAFSVDSAGKVVFTNKSPGDDLISVQFISLDG